jgi:SAM-dependent methyltransferase
MRAASLPSPMSVPSSIPVEHTVQEPSRWVRRWACSIERDGVVLDVAAGRGRHARLLAALGHPVEAVDRDAAALSALHDVPGVVTRVADLEADAWPYRGRAFAAVVVANYLHRPLLPLLIDALAANGILIYETFAVGNERFGRPSNPAFLLRPGELLETVRGRLRVIAYEDVQIDQPKPAMVQRICARRG